jgi:hypothetical protein
MKTYKNDEKDSKGVNKKPKLKNEIAPKKKMKREGGGKRQKTIERETDKKSKEKTHTHVLRPSMAPAILADPAEQR